MEITPSLEQINIINPYIEGKSLRVITPAGGSKTTTALLCVRYDNRSKYCLFITFSSRLKLENQQKVEKWGLNGRMEAHSFHGIASKLYKTNIHDDNNLRNNLRYDFISKPIFNILIIDEAQDLTYEYYSLIIKIINTCKVEQIMLIGDPRQNIFHGITNSSDMYLMDPDRYFYPFKFTKIENYDSYRLTMNMVSFINDHFLGNGKIVSRKNKDNTNEKIDYWIYNPFTAGILIHRYIERYGINDIFILAPSTKNPSLIAVVDYLKSNYGNQVPICVHGDEETKISDEEMFNKLNIMTFHKSKGLERKCVIVFGFEEYFDRSKFNQDQEISPNILYVGLTRSIEKLVIIADGKRWDTNLQHTVMKHCYKTIKFPDRNLLDIRPEDLSNDDIKEHFSPYIPGFNCHDKVSVQKSITELIQHLPPNFIDKLMNTFKYEQLQKPSELIFRTNYLIKIDERIENISRYYGILMTFIFGYKSGKFNLFNYLIQRVHLLRDQILRLNKENVDTKTKEKLLQYLENYLILVENPNNVTYNILFKISVCVEAISGYTHEFYQLIDTKENIDSKLDSEYMNNCISRLAGIIPQDIEYDINKDIKDVCKRCSKEIRIITVGRVDIRGNDYIYEVKAKESLSRPDFIQSGIYSLIVGLPCILINLQTNEQWKITGSVETLQLLIGNKLLYKS